jgi:hypothetical protein
MIDSSSEFFRFKYRDENFQELRDYCEDNNIWICQSLRKSGPMTFALARDREIAARLSAQFG